MTFIDIDRAPFVEAMQKFYGELAEKGELPEGYLEAVEATRSTS